jgi:hypothetical protein
MRDNLRDWRERRSVIRDGVDVRALVSGRSLSPGAEDLLFPPENTPEQVSEQKSSDDQQQ